jgi:hypothetical protein
MVFENIHEYKLKTVSKRRLYVLLGISEYKMRSMPAG